MNFFKKALVLSMSLISSVSFAETQVHEGGYVGLKAGMFMLDLSGVDDPTLIGFQGGYSFGNNWSIELEYGTGSTDVKSVDIDVSSMGLYGIYRSEGQAYFLGKIGVAKNEIEISGGLSGEADDTGLAYGLGGGYNFNQQFGIEAEYNIVDSDISVFAVTGRYMF